MRWLVGLVWLGLITAAPAADLVILRGDRLAAEAPARAADTKTYADRLATAVGRLGVTPRVVSDVGLTAAQLAGAALVVLPYNKLDDAQVAVLAAYVAGGGRIMAWFATGSTRLADLLGVSLGALGQPDYPDELARIRFDAAARQRWPGLPEAVVQNSWHAFALTPRPGTRVLGRWGTPPRAERAAITENAAGWYVGHVPMPGDLDAKGRLLLALAARDHPELWAPAVAAAEARALQGVELAGARWQKLSAREDLPANRRAALEDKLQKLRAEVAPAAAPEGETTPPGTPPGDIAGRPGGETGPGDAAAQRAVQALDAWAARAGQAEALVEALASSPAHELRGLWVYGGSPIDWPKLCAQVRGAGLNAIFYRVSRGGSAVYPSAVLPREPWSEGRDELAEGLATCRRYGLEFHAWRVCFHLGSSPTAYRAQLRAEGRLCADADGREVGSATPADPRNRAVEQAAIRELAERYDVDGIHLDYIRYPDEPTWDLDYSAASRRLFEADRGAAVGRWPDDVRFGALKEEYIRWQQAHINEVVREAGQYLAAAHPRVCFSAAVWRRHQTWRYLVKQDWPRWLEAGWLDLLVPMDYVKTAAELGEHVREQVSLAGGQTPVVAGLGAWMIDSPAGLVEQVEAVRANGAAGFVLFSNQAPDLDRQLVALARGATTEPAVPSTAAPRASWRLPWAVARPNAPAALPAGSRVPLELVLGPRTGTLTGVAKAVTATVEVVRPETGEVLAEVGRAVGLDNARLSFIGQFTAPEGLFQLRVRGQLERADAPASPFDVPGPLVQGWTAAEEQDWRARSAPPVLAADVTSVGVLTDGVRADSVVAALDATPGLRGVALERLPDPLPAGLRTLIVPQLNDSTPLHEGGSERLRAWVAAGGTLLLGHDAVGYRAHPTLFPEAGWAVRAVNRTAIRAAPGATIVPAGWSLTHRYRDHLLLAPGPAARAQLVDAQSGEPVVVEAAVGQGRVILCGLMLGESDGPVVEAERVLLLRLAGLAAP